MEVLQPVQLVAGKIPGAKYVELDSPMEDYLSSQDDTVHVIKAALLDASDKLDALGFQNVADDVDNALAIMAEKCDC